APNATYWRIRVVFDRSAETIKRCERCQAIHLHLRTLGDSDVWPDERLDCGEEYAAHWGEAPPEAIAALAFALPGEVRAEEEHDDDEPTLTDALAAAGYTHRAATCEEAGARTYARAIVDSEGRVVAVLRAGEAWAWLRERSEEGER
ncbi:MAG TPA: hypothetical protein VFS15_25825, partial [Kofleriaceae bacterium]|nr:hypothetical protein [Kofleriaceae bacterium]